MEGIVVESGKKISATLPQPDASRKWKILQRPPTERNGQVQMSAMSEKRT